ncbi:glycosyltransferase [Aliarcobacter cryaerophilus]|uniref:glycosyltransferase n=1 Tax=Aliarcobacter cryaerophilus TaxID=28198 RepID=UPI003DA6C777
MNIIFVNATALITGGGLVTLKQFLENIPEDINFKYFIFCSDYSLQEEYNKKNVKYIYPKYKTGLKRLYWDMYGFQKWSNDNCIKPDLVISLQNTTVKFYNKEIPQISYIMQAIPFVNKNWNLFKKQERTLWFYKNIYPFFMSMNLGKKHYVVTQSKWIKYEFSNKFNFPLEKIFAIRPVIKLNDSTEKMNFDKNTFNIFCPSSAFIYKNNIEIVNALTYLKLGDYDISKIRIHITVNSNDDSVLMNTIIKNKLSDNFNFIGRICYQDMLKFYSSCDLVVFPSYLETFGLPLLEAASFGKPILAANEGYAQEVISDYEGAQLLDINSPEIWAKAILKTLNNSKVYKKYKADFKESWKDFFQLIKNIINKEI